MKDLLLPPHRAALARFVATGGPGVLLAFDYDGVLAPLVRDPRGASMSARTRALVSELARRYPVGVISGRSFTKLRRVMGEVVPHLVGSHGVEFLRPAPATAAVERDVRRWERQVRSALDGVPGIHLEHKGSTFTLHYARAAARARAGRAVHRAAAALRDVRLVPGKWVLNVLPARFPTKGDAVRKLAGRLGCRRVLFVGDDVTDEDVFALPRRLVFGVHVGDGPSRAAWRLPARRDVDALLRALLALRPAPTTPAPDRRRATARGGR